jgi:hypothetical protein
VGERCSALFGEVALDERLAKVWPTDLERCGPIELRLELRACASVVAAGLEPAQKASGFATS